MNWTLIIGCVVGLWGMLSAFGGERRRQLNENIARKLAEEEAAAKPPESQPAQDPKKH